MKRLKNIPKFKTEEEEKEFWLNNDSTEYINWDDAVIGVFPNLKPSLKTISLRLPETMIYELKILANKRDIPYQTLLKQFLAERIQSEIKKVA